jgi:hypothetical protein
MPPKRLDTGRDRAGQQAASATGRSGGAVAFMAFGVRALRAATAPRLRLIYFGEAEPSVPPMRYGTRRSDTPVRRHRPPDPAVQPTTGAR